MPTSTFNHGTRVLRLGDEPRPIEVADYSSIGAVVTAPDADTSIFPPDEPVHFYTHEADKVAALGATGTAIDIVNAMDRREAFQLETEDYEWRRLPTWMANGTFHLGESTVQLLYIFDFEHDRQPLPGSPWYSPLIPPTLVTSGWTMSSAPCARNSCPTSPAPRGAMRTR